MRTALIGIAAALAMTSMATPARAQGYVGGTTIPYHVTGDITLGTGVNIAAPFQASGECITYASIESDSTGAYETRSDIEILSRFDQYRKETQVGLGFQSMAKASYGGVSVDTDFKVSGKFGDINDRQANSLVVMFSANSDNGRKIVINYSLKPGMPELLQNNPEQFKKQCGTHFVRAVHRISDATIFVTISNLSETGKNSLETSLEQTIGGGVKMEGLGAEGSAKITAEYKRIIDFVKKSSRVKVSYFARGGPGVSAAGALAAATDPTDLRAIANAVAAATSGFSGDNAAPDEYILTPYTVFGAPAAPFDPALVERIGKLTEQLIRVSDSLKTVKGYRTAIPSTYIKYFADMEARLIALRADLADRINACAAGSKCTPVESDILSDYVFLGDVLTTAKVEASCSYQRASSYIGIGSAKINPQILETISVNVDAVAPYYDVLDFSSAKILRMTPDFAAEDVTKGFRPFDAASMRTVGARKVFGTVFSKNIKPADTIKLHATTGEVVVDTIALSNRREEVLSSMYILEVAGPGGRRYGFNLGYPDRQNCRAVVQEKP